MAEYILQDKDKAAFINRMNKVLSQIGSGFGLDQSSFVDVPETEDDDKCIYIASTDVEEKVLDSLIDKNAFTYKVKKISVNEILREIKRDLGEAKDIYDKFLDNPENPTGRARMIIAKFIKQYGDSPSGMAADRFIKSNNLTPEEGYIIKYITKPRSTITSQPGGPNLNVLKR